MWCLLAVLASCGGNDNPYRERKFDLVNANPIKKRDSLTEACYQNKLFLATIIKLNPKDNEAYFCIDSPMFGAKYLTPTNRDDYYKKVVAALPPADRELYRTIWNIKEIREMQNGTGGRGTTVAFIMARPDTDNPYYLVDMRRNNIEELPPEHGISALKIRLKPLQVQLADHSGYYISLEEWQHVNQTK